MDIIQTVKFNTATLKRHLAVLGLGCCLATQGYAANSGNSDYVSNVDINFPGLAAVITVKNVAANKHVNSVDLQVEESSIDIEATGFAQCGDDKDIDFHEAKIYFGPVTLFVDSIIDSDTLYQKNYGISHKTRINNGKWITEGGGDTVFNVPLNQIKNGAANLKVDALNEINKKLQAHIQGGGKAVDFYKQDHDILIKRPVTIAAWCKKAVSFSQTLHKAGFETKEFNIQIKYVGDDEVNEQAQLNAQLANNMPNQVNQNPNLPFKLNSAEFQPNLPHHVGKCIPDKNPKLRMNFTVSGGKKGLIDLRVAAVSNQYAAYGYYFETADMVRDPKNGNSHLDFNFPLKEMLAQQQYSWMAIANNKTHSHNMRIEARYKNFENGTWTNWEQYGTAVYKHRCTPQLNGQLNGGNNGGIGGFQDQNNDQPNAKPMQIKPMTPKPGAKPLQVKPMTPKPATPARKIQAQPQDPTPPPQLNIKAQEVEDKPRRAL